MAVIRTYSFTYTARGVVDVPYRCSSCHLVTTGHAQCEGVGKTSSAVVRPDEEAARRDAQLDLEKNGRLAVSGCPCPRCGAASEALLAAMAEYDAKYPQGQRGRRLSIFLVGFAISASIALACIASMIAFPSKGSTASDMVGAALCGGSFLLAIGSAIAAIVTFVVGPGPRPVGVASIPPTVWFDRPPN